MHGTNLQSVLGLRMPLPWTWQKMEVGTSRGVNSGLPRRQLGKKIGILCTLRGVFLLGNYMSRKLTITISCSLGLVLLLCFLYLAYRIESIKEESSKWQSYVIAYSVHLQYNSSNEGDFRIANSDIIRAIQNGSIISNNSERAALIKALNDEVFTVNVVNHRIHVHQRRKTLIGDLSYESTFP